MKRLVISLTKPSRIGLFLKDKIYIPLLIAVAFLMLGLGIFAIKCFNTNYLINLSEISDKLIIQSEANPNIKMENSKLVGPKYSVNNDDVYLSFNNQNYAKMITRISFNFQDEYVVISNLLRDVKVYYKDLGDINFNLSGVKKEDIYETSSFNNFMTSLSRIANPLYAAKIYVLDSLFYVLFYMGFVLLGLMIFTYFINPPISVGIRFKLVLYDSLIYFPFFIFGIFINFDYLRYFGVLFAGIFAFFTFSHIVKVKVSNGQ